MDLLGATIGYHGPLDRCACRAAAKKLEPESERPQLVKTVREWIGVFAGSVKRLWSWRATVRCQRDGDSALW
jgi:hypothetical protein